MELKVIKQSICDMGKEFRQYQVCVLLSKEFKAGSINQVIVLECMKKDLFEEIILTYGQQAVNDAPEAMKHLLTPDTYEKLCREYHNLKSK